MGEKISLRLTDGRLDLVVRGFGSDVDEDRHGPRGPPVQIGAEMRYAKLAKAGAEQSRASKEDYEGGIEQFVEGVARYCGNGTRLYVPEFNPEIHVLRIEDVEFFLGFGQLEYYGSSKSLRKQ